MTDDNNAIPVRFSPPLGRSTVGKDGRRYPVMEPVFVECGQRATLGGQPVQCIRAKGHPVLLNYAHTNGYKEWAFDEEVLS